MLSEFFRQNPKVALAFSGGTDSAYLLYAAKKYGADVQAYYIKTEFQPDFEYRDAVKLCDILDVELKVIKHSILSEREISSNPDNRCYYCKRSILTVLKKQAQKDGYTVIIDGTNASDDASGRPGTKALSELSVLSPLRESGLTKDMIRELSREAGLFTWDKPAYACLATRIKTGNEITGDLLKRVELSENELFDMGFSDFRIRVYNNDARLQIKKEQFAAAAEKHEEIRRRIMPYFKTVLLDMEAR